jgi:4-diphosphocytidyl-2-C-methyl-D-erythritol kinase
VRRVLAPAKLTLSLSVTGVRPDGYHELRAEMVSVSLCDELTFTEGSSGLTFQPEVGTRAGSFAPVGGNLITRALAAVGREAAVHVVKRIPLGGGLGGGSTDAAAVLRWAGCSDPDLARSLGSDVPFSMLGGRALVEGTGERVTPLPFEPRQFLLLVPPFGVDTARVYAAWDELAGTDGTDRTGGPGGTDGTGNALTEAALRVEPRLAAWRDALGELSGRVPRLAGSGSTWFTEESPPNAGHEDDGWLRVGEARARLVRTHTVAAGWEGD